MFALTNKPEMGARLYESLVCLATDSEKGTNVMQVIQFMSGALLETYMVFAKPDIAMQASFTKLGTNLGCALDGLLLSEAALPPSHIIDRETECGRHAARHMFEDWLDCAYEFHDLMLTVIENVILGWEAYDQPRAETYRLLYECTMRAMAYEVAAQELCDVVIDKKVSLEGWSLCDCVASLSAIAGHRLAMSLSNSCQVFRGTDLPDSLDQLCYVMTQEAVRLGVPAGSDWRFGLAANDMPLNAPYELVYGIEPYCNSFFQAIQLRGGYDQAVACAKAAGRMIAVAAGGEEPELEPVIIKPLAMAAITETYKSVCMDQKIVSY